MDDRTTAVRRGWPDAALLAVLFAVAVLIHGWIIAHTEVAARDSIGFIRYALELQNQPWLEVLRHAEQHPAYPVALLAVSYPVRYFVGVTCESMMLSAQLASALAGILLVVPLFYLGRELFDRRVGFWAALLFQVLPSASRITSDGLSDSTYFLLATTALVLAARALRRRSLIELALCGLSSALAYLTRPEGALIGLVVLLVSLCLQAARSTRWPWRHALAGALVLTLGFMAAAGPYMGVIGSFSRKPTSRKFLNLCDETDTLPPPPDQVRVPRGPLLAVWWSGLWSGCSTHRTRPPLVWGVWALVRELVRASQSVLWLPMLLGLWRFRGRLVRSPGLLVVFLVVIVYALIVARMAVVVGYLSERHMLFLVLCGTLWAAAELVWWGDRLAAFLAGRGDPLPARWRLAVVTVCLSVLPAALATDAFHPLHANRAGHRAAGLWLRAHFRPGDEILDPFCWAHYYAGAVFAEGLPTPPGAQRARYVVLEGSNNQHSRLPLMVIARQLATHAVPVYRWVPQPGQRCERAAEVIVYAIQPPNRAN